MVYLSPQPRHKKSLRVPHTPSNPWLSLALSLACSLPWRVGDDYDQLFDDRLLIKSTVTLNRRKIHGADCTFGTVANRRDLRVWSYGARERSFVAEPDRHSERDSFDLGVQVYGQEAVLQFGEEVEAVDPNVRGDQGQQRGRPGRDRESFGFDEGGSEIGQGVAQNRERREQDLPGAFTSIQ